MQPIIPLQPYIREGEGHGSAYILPATNKFSAMDILLANGNKRRQERLADKRQLQKDLIELETVKGNLLPEHQRQLLQKKNELVDWYVEQQKAGKRPHDINSDSYFEGKKKLAELAALAKNGEVARNYVVEKGKAFTQDSHKFRPDSWTSVKEGIESTPLDKLDYSSFPNLQEQFDELKTLSDFEKTQKPETEEKQVSLVPLKDGNGHVVRGQYLQTNRTAVKNRNKIVDNYVNTLSDIGREHYLNKWEAFQKENPDYANKVVADIVSKNSSAATNHKLLENSIIRYMASPTVGERFADNTKQQTVGENLYGINNNANYSPGTSKMNGFIITTTPVQDGSVELSTRRREAIKAANPNFNDEDVERAYQHIEGKNPIPDGVKVVKTAVTSEKVGSVPEDAEIKDENGNKMKGKVTEIRTWYGPDGKPIEDLNTMLFSGTYKGKPFVKEIPLNVENFASAVNKWNGTNINQAILDNTGGQFGLPENLVPKSAVAKGKQSAPTKPAKSEQTGTVRVKNKAGQIGNIPASQLASAIKQGYVQVK